MPNDPAMRMLSLKKGPQALSVFITVAPAQNNATSVQYSALPLKTDLPFTKDATNIEYSPDRPLLTLVTAEPVDKALDFYRKELGASGWSLWSEKTNGKQAPGGPSGMVHEKGGYAHYVTDKDPSVALVLTLQKAEAGKSKVEIKQWPAGILAAEHQAYINSDNRGTPAVDVSRVARLDGAQVVADRTTEDRMVYSVPGTVAATTAAVKQLLAADGWKPFVEPLEENSSLLWLKKGRQGLSVSFTQTSGQAGQSSVYYSPKRLTFAVPFPADADDVVFDDNRPYLSAVTSAPADATGDFFRKELTAAGWAPLSATDAAAKWPGAKIDEKAAYYLRGNDRVISVALKPHDGGRLVAEVRVPPFARPQNIEFDKEIFGLPAPKLFKSSGGTGGDIQREVHAHIPAEVDTGAGLLSPRAHGTQLEGRDRRRRDQSGRRCAQIHLAGGQRAAQAHLQIRPDDLQHRAAGGEAGGPGAGAARAERSGRRYGEPAFARCARRRHGRQPATLRRRHRPPPAPQAGGDSAEALRPLANNDAPVPVPDTAEDIDFADGKLEFSEPVQRQSGGGLLSLDHAATGLAVAELGDQQRQHGRAQLLEGPQRRFLHHHEDGQQDQCQRGWLRL